MVFNFESDVIVIYIIILEMIIVVCGRVTCGQIILTTFYKPQNKWEFNSANTALFNDNNNESKLYVVMMLESFGLEFHDKV